MKIKDLIDLKGCYSAKDVGEKEIPMNANLEETAIRFETERFKFDVINYVGALNNKMKYIRIFCKGAMQTQIWLDEKDVEMLIRALS